MGPIILMEGNTLWTFIINHNLSAVLYVQIITTLILLSVRDVPTELNLTQSRVNKVALGTEEKIILELVLRWATKSNL